MEERKPPYMISYNHKGNEWTITLWAESWEDAQARLKSIGFNGRVTGSNVQVLPRVNAVSLPIVAAWAAFVCWWRNLGRRA